MYTCIYVYVYIYENIQGNESNILLHIKAIWESGVQTETFLFFSITFKFEYVTPQVAPKNLSS